MNENQKKTNPGRKAVAVQKDIGEDRKKMNAGNKVTARRIVAVRKGADVAGKSQGLNQEDVWKNFSGPLDVLEPPYDLLTLAMMPEHNSELGQCIEAMKINIEGFGYKFKSRILLTEQTPDNVKKEVANEQERLKIWFDNCNIDMSFPMLRKITRHDLESTGVAYWEVIPKPSDISIVDSINHIPCYTVKLTKTEDKFTEYEYKKYYIENGQVKEKVFFGQKRFRRFVQVVGEHTVYFKEWDDPRSISSETGEVLGPKATGSSKEAHPMIYFKLYCPRSPYGLPRYIGNLFSIYGSRAAEEINYVTFTNNNVPSLVLMVSNGQLSEDSVDRIQEYLNDLISPSDNYSKILVLESEPMFEEDAATGRSAPATLDIKPLTQNQIQDAMFQIYDKNNLDKIRRSFRLSPLYVGRSDEYTRSTAEVARKITDEQVFNPERQEFDWAINRTLMPRLNAKYTVFASNTPNVTHDEDLIKMLFYGERTGGISPQIAREILADVMGRDLPPVDDKNVPADVPFSLTLAREAKKEAPVGQGELIAKKSLDSSDEDKPAKKPRMKKPKEVDETNKVV